MKIIIAIDSFKDSVTSIEAANSIEKGIIKVFPKAEIIKFPIADGGEGTVEVLIHGTNGKIITTKVHNPIMQIINAQYGILGDNKTAVIEMAKASGLPLLTSAERNPLKTTTYGTGELILDAIKRGCRKFIIGIGGSATNDAGVGMLQALGYIFYDKNGNILNQGGEVLNLINSYSSKNAIPELKECKFSIACDVTNPLYGKNGAAYIYAPQKGADKNMVSSLDKGLKNFANLVAKNTQIDIVNIEGSGAAGGLGGCFKAFLNSELKSGINIIMDTLDFEKQIENADFIITGEGRIDSQTINGKAPIGISKLAKEYDIPVIAIAGSLADESSIVHKHGITACFSIINNPVSLKEILNKEKTELLLEKQTIEIFLLIRACKYS